MNCSVLDVIISGFFDSIKDLSASARGNSFESHAMVSSFKSDSFSKKPFRSLSWGQQRLLLITRAMVKYPPVLILDEPFQGA